MSRLLRIAVLALGVQVLGGARDARADDNETRALKLFEKSEGAYDEGHFAEALSLLKQAYALKAEPVLLYNMGRAYEGLGDLASAASSYEQFLKAQPDTPDRGALERRIVTLRRQIAERQALAQKAKEQPAPRSPSAVPWIVAGVGAAGLVAGGVIGELAITRHDKAGEEPTLIEADRLQSQAKSLATTANVCLVAGGVVLLVGAVWGLFDIAASNRSNGKSASLPLAISF